jgi:DNA-binding transcriptional ArsR family regulator
MCPPGSGSTARRARPKRPATKSPKSAAKKGVRQRATEEARRQADGLIQPNVHIVARDPLRIQILSQALVRAVCAMDYATETGIPYATVAYHFRVLREAGYLELVAEVKVKGAAKKKMYRAAKTGLISDAEWGRVKEVLRPGVAGAILQDWNGRVADAIESKTLFTRDDACLYWIPRLLDENTWPQMVEAVHWIISFAEELEIETVERRARGESSDATAMYSTFGIGLFPSPVPEEGTGEEEREPEKLDNKSLKKPKPKTSKKRKEKRASD